MGTAPLAKAMGLPAPTYTFLGSDEVKPLIEHSHRTFSSNTVNEKNLVAALERIGYVAVTAEALTPVEQVALFAQAG